MKNKFDVGDLILHKPTNEKFFVILCEYDKVYYLEYPPDNYFNLSDCELIKKTNRVIKQNLLNSLSKGIGDELPRIKARETIANSCRTILENARAKRNT